jgi:hypothetical protein
MRTRGKLLLAGLIAAVALGAAIGTADARRFELSNQRIRATWAVFRFEDTSLVMSRCPITIEGSFHSRTISKVSGQLIGYITDALTKKEGCGPEFNSLWMDEGGIPTLPWHVRYDSFAGTLPTINTIRIQLINLGVKFEGTTCEYKSSAARPAYLRLGLTAGTVTSVVWEELTTIPRINGPCAAEGKLAGTGSMTVQGATTAIIVRLVQ